MGLELWVALVGCVTFEPAADRTWRGGRARHQAGLTIDVSAAAGSASILIAAPYQLWGYEEYDGQGRVYRVSPTTPSGRLDEVAEVTYFSSPEGASYGNTSFFLDDGDGDGDPDVLIGGSVPGVEDAGIELFDAGATGIQRSGEGWGTLHSEEQTYVQDCGDLDGDARSDLCLSPVANDSAKLLFGPFGPQTDAASAQGSLSIGGDAYSFLVYGVTDLDGDGASDLLVNTWSPNGVVLATQVGRAAFDLTAAPAWRLPGTSPGVPAVGDFDCDGDLEFASGGVVFDGRAGGRLRDAEWRLILDDDPNPVLLVGATAAGDFDGDGCDDLAVHSYGRNLDSQPVLLDESSVVVFRGPLRGTADATGAAVSFTVPSGYATLEAEDLDDDGRADLVVGAPYASPHGKESGAVMLYLGTTLFPAP